MAIIFKSHGLIAWVVGCASAVCYASDYSLFFTISNPISHEQPSTSVTLWAAFPPQLYAFGMSNTEVWSAGESGDFSDPMALLDPSNCYCDTADVAPDGDSITGIRILQLQFLGGEFADTHNPLELWSATWTTDDFTPRTVPIWTQSADFYVYLGPDGGENFYGDDFSEAQGFIKVVSEGCYPDFTGDGVLDLFDFLAYVNAFNAQDPSADCDQNGSFDLFDFLCFVNAFNAGC